MRELTFLDLVLHWVLVGFTCSTALYFFLALFCLYLVCISLGCLDEFSVYHCRNLRLLHYTAVRSSSTPPCKLRVS